MSLNSPAKYERIERHLQRQRGAGARTVQVDFGFSFAGFSAPVSQESTASTIRSEPSPKRRKTVTEDTEDGPEGSRSSALDRKEKTKTARTKRRFDMHVEEEVSNVRGTKAGDEDDSFVVGAALKKRKAIHNTATNGSMQAVQSDELSGEAATGAPETAEGASSKAQPKRKRRTARNDAPMPDDGAEPAAKGKTRARKQAGITRKTKEVMRQDTDAASAQVEEPETEMVEETKPTAKRRAPKRATKERVNAWEDSEQPQQDDSPDPDSVKPQRRVAKRPLKPKAVEPVDHPAEKHSEPPVAEVTTPNPRRKMSGRPKAGAKSDMLGPLDIATKSTSAANDVHTVTGNGPLEEGRKLPIQTPHAAEEAADIDSVPTKRPGKASKSKVAKKAILDSTPPELERRPLQAADANRSPSSHRSPEKTTDKMGNMEAKDLMPLRKSRGKPDCAPGHTKRKREDPVSNDVPSQKSPRKSRKLRVQRDEAHATDEGVEPGARKLSIALEVQPAVAADKQESSASAQELSLAQRERATRTASTSEKARHHSPVRRPATSAKARQEPPASDDHLPDGREEDVDWLFAAPPTQREAAPCKAKHPKPTAPRKTKLADIDLDDLIANVAAFAQPSGAAESKPVEAARGLVQTSGRRKRR